MENQRHLFDIQHRGKRLSVAVRTKYRQRTYIGSIDGQVCATAPAKGTLLRLLVEMSSQEAAA
ncbi:MAG TPA: hypothetical protein VFI23_03190 [Rhizomicrobium sp.]|nr:hypothetical protein [Rhizomicrobium sp.]